MSKILRKDPTISTGQRHAVPVHPTLGTQPGGWQGPILCISPQILVRFYSNSRLKWAVGEGTDDNEMISRSAPLPHPSFPSEGQQTGFPDGFL